MDRRGFLRFGLIGGAGALLVPQLARAANGQNFSYGPLGLPDANGIALPAGFTSRVVATTGREVGNSSYVWHAGPDGGACFAQSDGGWVYVSNVERDLGEGGVAMIRFDPNGGIADSRRVLSGTNRNCAGGPTPWGTWLSCEEVYRGSVWEVDPRGINLPRQHHAMGYFSHEAASVDPVGRTVYMTEDNFGGGLYRYRPTVWPDLSSGVLEIMTEINGHIDWARVPNPNPTGTEQSCASQVSGTKIFNRGEGAWFENGHLYFSTTGDNRVWRYTPATNALTVIYDIRTHHNPILSGVDNLTVHVPSGDVFLCEDGGDMEVVVLLPDGSVEAFCRFSDSNSELCGAAFDPSGTRLYVSSQRSPGRTCEITGPFRGTGTEPPTTTTTMTMATTTTTVPTTTTTAPTTTTTTTAATTTAPARRLDVEFVTVTGTLQNRNKVRPSARVGIIDAAGNRGSGVAVQGRWSRNGTALGGVISSVTGADGTMGSNLNTTEGRTGDVFSFNVISISAPDGIWDDELRSAPLSAQWVVT